MKSIPSLDKAIAFGGRHGSSAYAPPRVLRGPQLEAGNPGLPAQDRRVEWDGFALDAALHAWLVETSDSIRPSTRAGLYDAFKTHVVDHPELTLEELLTSINVRCTRFADEFETPEAKAHIDWAVGKPEGFGFGGR